MDTPAYAAFSRRFLALVLDSLVYFGAALGLLFALTAAPVPEFLTIVGMLALMLGLIAYEPIMVSQFGGTLGHQWVNLKVVDNDTDGNPSLWRAFVRFIVKGLLGWLSFITMALTVRHQALHDLASSSTVQIRDLGRAHPHHYRAAREEDTAHVQTSSPRRVLTALCYVIFFSLLLMVASGYMISDSCAFDDICTQAEEFLLMVIGLVWLIGITGLVLAGWKGFLIGARRRPA